MNFLNHFSLCAPRNKILLIKILCLFSAPFLSDDSTDCRLFHLHSVAYPHTFRAQEEVWDCLFFIYSDISPRHQMCAGENLTYELLIDCWSIADRYYYFIIITGLWSLCVVCEYYYIYYHVCVESIVMSIVDHVCSYPFDLLARYSVVNRILQFSDLTNFLNIKIFFS